MSGYAYEYDPAGTNPANVVENETHPLANYPNKWNCIIPRFAPFYRKDFTLRHVDSGRELLEGIDYYLGHRFVEASTENRMPVYGSVMLNDTTMTGEIEFVKYRTLGAQYNVPFSEILIYLSKEDNKDPRNCDWSDVMKYPAMVPPLQRPGNIDEAIAQDAVTAATHRLYSVLKTKFDEEGQRYDELIAALEALEDKAHDHDIDNHSAKRNAHRETYAQIGALKQDATAANAVLAYGKTLGELTAIINRMGIQQYHLDARMLKSGGNLYGQLHMSQDSSYIHHDTGSVLIDEVSGEIRIVTKDSLRFVSEDATFGSGAAFQSGNNSLSVHASGDEQDSDAVIYNGYYVVSAGNIQRYLPPPSFVDTLVYTQAGGEINWRGDGLEGTPLEAHIEYPRASTDTAGIALIGTSAFDSRDSVAASPAAVRIVGDMESSYVDNSITVNGKSLVNDITIVKADIAGFENVDNTAPTVKPASDAFKAAVALKTPVEHTHTTDEVTDIVEGDQDNRGIAKISRVFGPITDAVAHPEMMTRILESFEEARVKTDALMPGWLFNIVQFGGYNYLPLPVQGRYGAGGVGVQSTAAELESDNTLVLLRNGSDIAETGVYYSQVGLNSQHEIVSYVPTTTEYQPKFLRDAGRKAAYVLRGDTGTFCLVDDLGQYWVVLTRGTMDSSKHVGARLNLNGMNIGNQTCMSLWRDKVLFVYGTVDTGGIHFRAWTIPISDIEDGRAVTPTPVLLSGETYKGYSQSNVSTLWFCRNGVSTDPNAEVVLVRYDDGYWSHADVRHASQNSIMAVEGNKARFMVAGRPYCSNSSGSIGGNIWTMSFVLDLDGGESIFEDKELMPFKLYTNRVETGYASGHSGYPTGFEPNNVTTAFTAKGIIFTYSCYSNERSPYLYAQKPNDGKSVFETLERKSYSVTSKGSAVVVGAYGSPVRGGMRRLAYMDNNKLAFYHSTNGTSVIAEYDPDGEYLPGNGGFGPTPNRKEVSYTALQNALAIPRVSESASVEYNRGLTLGMVTKSNYAYLNDETPEDLWSWTDVAISNLLNDFRAGALSDYDNSLRIADTVTLNVYGDPRNPLEVFALYSVFYYNDSSRTVRSVRCKVQKATLSYSGSTINAVNLGTLVSNIVVSGSATALNNDPCWEFGQNSAFRLDDGRWGFVLQNMPYVGWVGHGGGSAIVFIQQSPGNSSSYHTNSRTIHTTNTYGFYFHRKFGLHWIRLHSSGEGVALNLYGKTWAEIDGWAEQPTDIYIMSPRVSEGWNIYFTEEVPLYYKHQRYMIPTGSIDLRDVGGEYIDQMFYLYVNITTGWPSYEIRREKVPDEEGIYYIGFARTGKTQIDELYVERFTRLGRILEMEDHVSNKYAHGGNVPTPKPETFGLEKMQNMGMSSEVEIPTLADIFNRWHRFSHNIDTEAQPANAGETTSWEYVKNANGESIRCLINSATYIGFVSPNTFGDYVFDIIMQSTHADNDAVAMVLGYVEVNGRECTLSAVRAGSLESHLSLQNTFEIWYNYRRSDAKRIAALPTQIPGDIASWSNRSTRIRAVRKGNKIVVQTTPIVAVAAPTIANLPDSMLTYKIEVDLTSDVQLTKFQAGARYGVGCLSQPDVYFYKVSLPDEDLSGKYASADVGRLIRENAEGRVEVKTFLTGTASSSDSSYVYFPKVAYPNGVSPTTHNITVAAWPSFDGVVPTELTTNVPAALYRLDADGVVCYRPISSNNANQRIQGSMVCVKK